MQEGQGLERGHFAKAAQESGTRNRGNVALNGLACRYDTCRKEVLHPTDDLILLGKEELREHGKRNDLSRNALGDGKVSGFVTEMLIGFLLMKENRVVDPCANSGLQKTRLQCFSILYTNDVEVVNTFRPGSLNRNYHRILHFRKQLVIPVGKI